MSRKFYITIHLRIQHTYVIQKSGAKLLLQPEPRKKTRPLTHSRGICWGSDLVELLHRLNQLTHLCCLPKPPKIQQATMRKPLKVVAVWIGAIASLVSVAHGAPDGFGERQLFKNGFMTDLTFTSDGRMFVTQKIGLVHIYEPGDDFEYGGDEVTVLDIVDDVCYENERGLGGIQLHPNFDSNGWM